MSLLRVLFPLQSSDTATGNSFAEFKKSLNKQQNRFLRGLAEKLFIYALDRPIEGSDREAINGVITTAPANGSTLASIIKAIAATSAFQTK